MKKIILTYENIKNNMVKLNKNATNFYFTDEKGQRYYFKSNNYYTFDYNEIISNRIAKKVKLINVSIFPCTYINEKGEKLQGVISKDFIKNRKSTKTFNLETLINKYNKSVFYNSVESIINLLNTHIYIENKTNTNKKVLNTNVESKLKLTALFLYLTGQQDFAEKNFEFVEQKTSGGQTVISLLPYIDNSLTFFKLFDKDKVSQAFYENPKQAIVTQCNSILMIKDEAYDIYKPNKLAIELAIEITENKELKEQFKILYNLNLKNEIKRFCQKTNFKIDDKNIKNATNYYQAAKSLLLEKINLIDKSAVDYILGVDKTQNLSL